jgi:purine-binding chemotaxis protein CheW
MELENAPAPHGPGDSGPALQYLTFSLDEEVFAMDIRGVREIIQQGNMTMVPLMPAFVRGVINLRGSVVPVIDLQSRFGRARAQVGKKTCIIIFATLVADEKVELGLLVDSVSEVIDIATAQVEPPPQFGTSIRRDFVHGIARVGQNFIVILAPERALDINEMAALVAQTEPV